MKKYNCNEKIMKNNHIINNISKFRNSNNNKKPLSSSSRLKITNALKF